MSESVPMPEAEGPKRSKENKGLNPFELVRLPDGVKAPRSLLAPHRREDLERYIQGWKDQEECSDGFIIERDNKGSDNWYKAGATKCWTNPGAPAVEFEEEETEDLVSMMERMEADPTQIPASAFSDASTGTDSDAILHPDAHPEELGLKHSDVDEPETREVDGDDMSLRVKSSDKEVPKP